MARRRRELLPVLPLVRYLLVLHWLPLVCMLMLLLRPMLDVADRRRPGAVKVDAAAAEPARAGAL